MDMDMDTGLLMRGFLVGLAIGMPIGAIGTLCIRRALVDGRLVGLACWLGAATADALYATVAALGLSAVATALVDHRGWIRFGGGLAVCLLGIRALGSEVGARPVVPGGRRLGAAYASTFGLTLANPTTILAFAAIFSSGGVVEAGNGRAALLVAGVFLGSVAWYLPVGVAAGVVRDKLTPRRMRRLNRLFGAVLLGFGLVTVGSLVLGRDR